MKQVYTMIYNVKKFFIVIIFFILPGLFKIQTQLTYLAGAGLVLVMLGAIAFHLQRGEFSNIMFNLVLALVAGFIAYGRFKLVPLTDRSE